jgi:hypothetical protein
MEKINLEKILKQKLYITQDGDNDIHDTLYNVKDVVKEICKKVLELAAENAEGYYYNEEGVEYSSYVNKQSILDVINLIE